MADTNSGAGKDRKTIHFMSNFRRCPQLISDYCTAVHCIEARAQQSDCCMQDVGQQHLNIPRQQPATTSAWLLHQVQQVSEEAPTHNIQKHVPQVKKDQVLVSTYNKYLCLHVGSTCWSDTLKLSFALGRVQTNHFWGRQWVSSPIAREIYLTLTAGQIT